MAAVPPIKLEVELEVIIGQRLLELVVEDSQLREAYELSVHFRTAVDLARAQESPTAAVTALLLGLAQAGRDYQRMVDQLVSIVRVRPGP